MSELRRLAKVLSDVEADNNTCYQFLHWFGFNGFTLGFSAFLEYLITLEPALQRLKILYPNLEPFIFPFLLGRKWKRNLQAYLSNRESIYLKDNPNASVYELQTFVYSRFDTRFPRNNIHGPINLSTYHQWSDRNGALPIDIPVFEVYSSAHGPAFLLHAAAKVIFHTWRYRKIIVDKQETMYAWIYAVQSYRINFPSDGVINSTNNYHEDLSKELNKYYPAKLVGHVDIAQATLAGLVEALRKAMNKDIPANNKVRRHTRAYYDLIGILQTTQGKSLLEPTLDQGLELPASEPTKVKNPKAIRRQGYGMSSDLDEAELLPEAVHALNTDDWSAIQSIIFPPKNDGAQSEELDSWRYPLGRMKAATRNLVRIALCTAETPNRAARIRIFNAMSTNLERDDFKNLHRSSLLIFKEGYEDTDTHWITKDAPDTGLVLNIPIQWKWNQNIVDAYLFEVFPIQLQSLLKFASDNLSSVLDRSEAKVRLTVKHTLARLLYAQTVDRAVIEYVCGKSNRSRSNAMAEGSLTHYVHQKSPIIEAAYTNAVNALFKPDGRPAALNIDLWHDKELFLHVSQYKLQSASRLLKNQVDYHSNRTLKERHNAIALYCGYLILLAFGIREQANILPFSWQLDLDDLIGFFCDKPLIGSEARFLPIPTLLGKQFEHYAIHLNALLKLLDAVDKRSAKQMRFSLGMADRDAANDTDSRAHLFLFEDDQVIPVSTQKLEQAIEKLFIENDIPYTNGDITGSLRPNVATYVANRTTSGMLIELLLGHNSAMHLFGPASSWIPEDAYRELLPILDKYLESCSVELLDLSQEGKNTKPLKSPIPAFETEYQAFEGREMDADEAIHFAKVAIHQVLNTDHFIQESLKKNAPSQAPDRHIRWIEIDEATVAQIKDAASEILVTNPHAKAKVIQVLAKMAEGWVKGKSYRINAASINLVRTVPGPIGIAYARRRTLFVHVQRDISAAIAKFLTRSGVTDIDRLGALAVMLVINDAVLALADLKALLSAAQKKCAMHFNGQAELRATVVTRDRIYDRTVDMTAPSTAALHGYLFYREGSDEISWNVIELSADRLLSTFTAGYALTLLQLIECGRAFWFVKLPGWAFSAAKGELAGTAPSPYSSQQLLGGPATFVKPVQAVIDPNHNPGTNTNNIKGKTKTWQVTAYKAITQLTAASEKYYENHERSSSSLRISLRDCLYALNNKVHSDDAPNLIPQLLVLMEKHDVVAVILDFIAYLLDVGGPKEEFLGFGSIKEYISRITWKIIEYCSSKEKHPRDFTSKEFDEMYAAVFGAKPKRSAAVHTALNIFHDFMRNTFNAPPCTMFPSVLRKPVRSRDALPMPNNIDTAIAESILREDLRQDIRESIACLIAISSAFGTRRKEGHGSRKNDYVQSQCAFKVRKNSTRDLKTPASSRVIPVSLATPVAQSYITDFYSKAPTDKTGNEKTAIFANPASRSKLLSIDAFAPICIAILKEITEDPTIVLHSWRHLYYTRILCYLYLKFLTTKIAVQVAQTLALEESAIIQIQSMHLEPERYPFWIFRLGRWMGHQNEKTGLTVYSHASWFIVSGICHQHSNTTPMTAGMAAALLGRSHRSISNWLAEQEHPNTSIEAMWGVINDTVQKSKLIPDIKSGWNNTQPQPQPKSRQVKPKPIAMHTIDSFLCTHREGLRSLDELPQHVHKTLNIPVTTATVWKKFYAEAVRLSGLLDFENPDDKPTFWKKFSVRLGQGERRYLLDLFQSQCEAMSLGELKALDGNLVEWLFLMDPKIASIVCRGISGLESLIHWLTSMGYKYDQIVIFAHKPYQTDTHWIANKGLTCHLANDKISKMEIVDDTSLFGVQITSSESLPTGRDVVRTLLACFIGLRTLMRIRQGSTIDAK